MSEREAIEEFACFGSTCSVRVIGSGAAGSAREAAALGRQTLLSWHRRFSRFREDSELSRLNANPRTQVKVSAMLARLALAVRDAGFLTDGLVDGTLVEEIERAGYAGELRPRLALERALALAPPRTPAAGSKARRWRSIQVDVPTRTLTRAPGVRIDSGGLAKGLFADVLAQALAGHRSFAVDCAGDLSIGGHARTVRSVDVVSPFGGGPLHAFELSDLCIATSGITRRSWLDGTGRPAHHLLDPSTGAPAFTGLVQVSALAPSALAAETYAKAALLSGPARARAWLRHGGVIVFDDGSHEMVASAEPSQKGDRITATAPAPATTWRVLSPSAASSCTVS